MKVSAILLLIVLTGYWFGLSGYFEKTVLLVTGGISVLIVLGLCWRMRILDSETVPYGYTKIIDYIFWLMREIAKANITVVKAVLSPDMKLTPTMVRVPVKHDTDLGATIFANSITLTPGTVSTEVNDEGILVHALYKDLAKPGDFEEMATRSGKAVDDAMTRKPKKKAAPKKKPATKRKKSA